MVRPSLNSPTTYAAVDIEIALETALKKQESELLEMEARKRELLDLSERQRLRPSTEVATFSILKNIKEIVSTAAPVLLSAEKDMVGVSPISGAVLSSMIGITEACKELIARGGRVRGVTNVSYSGIRPVQALLDVGEEVRHFEGYRGVF